MCRYCATVTTVTLQVAAPMPWPDMAEMSQFVAAARGLDPLEARAHLQRTFPAATADQLRFASLQAELQQQASTRFGPIAFELWWTRSGLEQASRPAVSTYRSKKILALGVTSVLDVSCGLGLDLVAYAQAGMAVTGLDLDGETASYAQANLSQLGIAGTVWQGDCRQLEHTTELLAEAWFVDPARRPLQMSATGGHRRILDPQQWSPPWSWVQSQRGRVPLLVAKASSAIEHDLVAGAQVEWLSVAGSLLETSVWWGDLPARRSAVGLTDTGAELFRVDVTDPEVTCTGLPKPGDFLVDPDPAIVRAHAVRDLAALVDATLVDPQLAYLVCRHPPSTSQLALGKWREVIHAGPYQPKVLRHECQLAGISHLDVTGRGRVLPVARVRKELRLGTPPANASASETVAATGGVLCFVGLGETRQTAVILTRPVGLMS